MAVNDWLDPGIFSSILTRILYNYIYISHTTQGTSVFRFVIQRLPIVVKGVHVICCFFYIQKSRLDDFLRCVFLNL